MTRSSLVYACLALVGLSACKSTPEQQAPQAQFSDYLQQWQSAPDSVSYQTLWNAYLNSDQIHYTAASYEAFYQAQLDLETGDRQCHDIDWQQLTELDFWSIQPHIQAASCYEQMNQPDKAAYQDRVTEFLLTGILSSGDGQHYYSAYVVPTASDADDVLELAGYEMVEGYFEFEAHRQGLYYVALVNDPSNQTQQRIYFDTQRFIHRIVDVQYPFLAIADGWFEHIVKPLADSDLTMRLPAAEANKYDEDYELAANQLMSAIADGSAMAYFRLGQLCLEQELAQFNQDHCLEFLNSAAEADILDAVVLLAYVFERGISVDADSDIAKQLLDSIAHRYGHGELWQQIAEYYRQGYLAEADDSKADAYIAKAAQAGHIEAQIYLIAQHAAQEESSENGDEYIQQLEALAKQGSAHASYFLGEYYHDSFDVNTAQFKRAGQYYQDALAGFIPDAYYKLAWGYRRAYWGEHNEVKSYQYFLESALRFHRQGQLEIGYMNGIGRVVEKDPQLAFGWYHLCASGGERICAHNLGQYYDKGIATEVDDFMARLYFEFAASMGYAKSLNSLANMLYIGEGGDIDRERAFELWLQAAEAGNQFSQYRIAKAFEEGEHFEQNLSDAVLWYKKAAQSNHYDAHNALRRLCDQGVIASACQS